MKKYFSIVVLMLLLFGCQSLEVKYNNIHPRYKGYATDVTIEEDVSYIDKLPQKSFSVFVKEIGYYPISKTVFIEYEIYDGSYRNATYMTVGRVGNSTLSDMTRLHRLTQNKGTFTEYFHDVDLSKPFHILFGKTDTDDLNPTQVVHAVKSITLLDKSWDNRFKIETHHHDFEQPKDFSTSYSPFIRFDYSLSDPSKGVDEVSFVLIEKETQLELSKITQVVKSHMRNEGIIEFEDIYFDDVAPGTTYDILVLVTGNDGVDRFSDVVIEVFRQKIGSYYQNEHMYSWHDLFAAITDIEIQGEDVIIRYMLHNNHTVKNIYGEEPVIDLKIVDGNLDTIYRLENISTNGEIRLKWLQFRRGAQITIYIREGYKNLAHYSIDRMD
jgi:hypothetical protein